MQMCTRRRSGVEIVPGCWGLLSMIPEKVFGCIGFEGTWVEGSGRKWEMGGQNKLKFPV